MEKLARIGQGRYSTVYAGIFQNSGKVDAWKEVRLTLSDSPVAQASLKAVLREILALRLIDYHPNIVHLRGYSVSKGSVCIRLEYCDWDLDKLLTYCDLNIPTHIVENMTHQIFTGLNVIHSVGLCHRDIKPSNILLCSSSGLLKISDFGLARPSASLNKETHLATREVCTRWNKSIEVLLGGKQGPPMDVWSAALVAVELMNHSPLFPGISDINQIYLIYQALGEPNPDDWPEFGFFDESRKLPFSGTGNFLSWDSLAPRACKYFSDILAGCLTFNPKTRFSAKQILDLEISYFSPVEISDWVFSI